MSTNPQDREYISSKPSLSGNELSINDSQPSPSRSHRQPRMPTPPRTIMTEVVKGQAAVVFPSHVRSALSKAPTDYTGELVRLLDDLQTTTHSIAAYVSSGNESAAYGAVGNLQGLNVHIPARQLYKALTHDGYCCLLFEKHFTSPLEFPEEAPYGDYVLCLNAMDTDMDTTEHTVVGTFFSVYKRTTPPSTVGRKSDLTQTLCKQVAAGFITYSSAVSLYYTVGQGVHNFILNPVARQFFLSRQSTEAFTLPSGCSNVYTDTESLKKEQAFKKAVNEVTQEGTPKGKLFALNAFTPSLHEALKSGALVVLFNVHLLCEAGPAAMLIEQAGGRATNGRGRRILDSSISDEEHETNVHATTTFVGGRASLVDAIEKKVEAFERVNGSEKTTNDGASRTA